MKRDAWHARLYLSFRDDKHLPDNACPYFWGLLWRAVMAVVWVGGLVLGLLGLPVMWALGFIENTPMPWWTGFIAYLALAVGFTLFGLASLFAKEDSLLRTFWAWIKNNYCPLLHWEGEEEIVKQKKTCPTCDGDGQVWEDEVAREETKIR